MAARRFYSYDSRERYLETQGVNDSWWIRHQGVGRESSDDSPYLVPNEWIASNIGAHFLRLPIPPFSLMRKHNEKGMFVSWKYGKHGIMPADVNPSACYASNPPLCAGIVAFDVFIGNSDRHCGNIKVDDPASPTAIEVFDHDHSLFGACGDAVRRLQSIEGKTGLDGYHCLASEVNDFDLLRPWIEKIRTIPCWWLEDLCDEVIGLGVTADQVAVLKLFLTERRLNLFNILKSNAKEFPKINNWPML